MEVKSGRQLFLITRLKPAEEQQAVQPAGQL